MTQQSGSITQGTNYTTRSGDTLSSIAQRAYNNSNDWTLISSYPGNQQALGSNPNPNQALSIGLVLFIPILPTTEGSGHVG